MKVLFVALQIPLTAAALAMLFATSCGGSTTLNAVVPFGQAHAIVKGWWPNAEAAFISSDPHTLKGLFSGSALEVAQGEMQMQALTGSKPKYPRPFRGSTIFGPSGGGDSVWFLAIIQYAPIDQDGRAAPASLSAPGMIFSQASGGWSVSALDVQAPIAHGTFGNVDSTFSTPLDDARYVMARSAIAAAYASYLNNLAAGQKAEVPFPTGIESFAWQFTRLEWPPLATADFHFTFDAQVPELADYAITSGFTTAPEVVIFVLRRTVAITSRGGCLIRRQGDLWSATVPPGAYRSVTLTSISVVAATVPFNDGDTSQGRKVIDISGGIDDAGATMVKC